ncbi:hypothetical protein HanHA300_Chr17g0648201 [Helianthus annuus]|nr:hypothetical protein HanHA300_Chr17g0648201 [Helianthus annuus]KAJ0446970.1 hypothetical protein HanHA89_Chr17g0700141 [Helianthus annuus]KAJ0631871.1 hypothetical protein HanLR1_Chr17g0658771 [Helianthus annuus]KAJ0635769.1 hypothetical protein HanOQP8_Chr17g0654491 [Helianthus annuus]
MESSFAQPSPMESSSAPPHYQRSPLNHMVTIRLQQQANHFVARRAIKNARKASRIIT